MERCVQIIAQSAQTQITKNRIADADFWPFWPFGNRIDPNSGAPAEIPGPKRVTARVEGFQKPATSSLDSGNLLPVAQAIRAAYPRSQILFAADNDAHLAQREGDRKMENIGVEKARSAALTVGNAIVLTAPEDTARTAADNRGGMVRDVTGSRSRRSVQLLAGRVSCWLITRLPSSIKVRQPAFLYLSVFRTGRR